MRDAAEAAAEAEGSGGLPRSPSNPIGAFFKRIRTRSKSPAAKGRHSAVAAREATSPTNGAPATASQRSSSRKRSGEGGSQPRTPRTPSKSRLRAWLAKGLSKEEPGYAGASPSPRAADPLTELRSQGARGALSEEDLVSKSLASELTSSTHQKANGSGDTKARTATMPPAMLSSYYSQDSVFADVVQKAKVPSYIRVSCALNGYPRPFRAGGERPLPQSIVERRLAAFTSPRSDATDSPRSAAGVEGGSVSVRDRVAGLAAGSPQQPNGQHGTPQGASAALPPKVPARRPAMSPPPVPNGTLPSGAPAHNGHGDGPPPKQAPNGSVSLTNGTTHSIAEGPQSTENSVPVSSLTSSAVSGGGLLSEVLAAVDDLPSNGHQETPSTSTSAPSEAKDAHWQKRRADEAREKLRLQAEEAAGYLDLSLPDDAENLVRVAYGKANLLMGKKFNKFYDLVHKNLNPIPNDPQPTLVDDLEGYWSIVEMEMLDIDDAFDTVHKLKAVSWDVSALPSSGSSPASKASTPSPRVPAAKRTSPRNPAATPTATKPSAGAGRSTEARRRLAEAKAAARRRLQDPAAQPQEDQIFS